jgi:hypothetical protein
LNFILQVYLLNKAGEVDALDAPAVNGPDFNGLTNIILDGNLLILGLTASNGAAPVLVEFLCDLDGHYHLVVKKVIADLDLGERHESSL